MEISIRLNGKVVRDAIDADLLLIDFLRAHGCLSVKRGCETSNCGLCTVLMDGKPVLSCSVLAARAHGHVIQTLEGLQAYDLPELTYFMEQFLPAFQLTLDELEG